jgi:hypothetical protein
MKNVGVSFVHVGVVIQRDILNASAHLIELLAFRYKDNQSLMTGVQ